MQATNRLLDLFPPLFSQSIPVKFEPPSIEEVYYQADKIGLPKVEAEKFFHYYEANGWMVGRTKMKVWRSALAGWKLRWMEREQRHVQRESEPSASVNIIKWQNALARLEEEMKRMRDYYGKTPWTEKDKATYKGWRAKKAELLRLLDMEV